MHKTILKVRTGLFAMITFIICSYNGERCLEKTIESILQLNNFETYTKQLILVNNNSSDNTKSIMENAAKKNNKIKVVDEKKPGLSNARLRGVNEAKGKWIAFIDDDNYLDIDWLDNAVSFIENNPRIGSFGGSIVPTFSFQLNVQQEAVLKVIYKSIAITNLDRNDIDYRVSEHPNKLPYGAGMVVRTDLMLKLRDMGWLSMEGRSGSKLTAGEDTEIGYFVKNQGFSVGYCPKMVLQHDIPTERLQLEYAVRLYEGIMEAVYMLSGRDNLWRLRRIKYLARVIKFELKVRCSDKKNIEDKCSTAIEAGCVRVLKENLKLDKVVVKNRYNGGR